METLRSYDKEFVGVVSAVQYTNLAFRVGGLVTKTYVIDGSYVKKGDLIAELDPSDILLQLSADQSAYETAQSTLARNERLLAKQAISTQDYEIAKSKFQQAKASYRYAQNQLEYTKLRAPFSGSVEKKYVENFQRIDPGEAICKVINPDLLDVKFVLPESDIAMTKIKNGYFVEFDNFRGNYFTASIKEVVDASVDGAGIPVTLSITDKNFIPEKYNIKPGFACRIKVLIEGDEVSRSFLTIPLTAIFTDAANIKDKFVWLYNPATSTVSRRSVTTNGLIGTDRMIINDGLASGEMVVTAGVYQIEEGQRVSLLQ